MLFSCYSMQKKKNFFKLSNNWSFLLATSTHIQSHLYESLSTSHKEDGEGHGRLIYSPWASLFFIDDRSLLGSELGSWHQGLQDAQSKLNMEVIGTKIPAPELQQMKSQPQETCKLDALPRLDVDEGLWLLKNVARKEHKSHFLLTSSSSSSFHLGEPGSREGRTKKERVARLLTNAVAEAVWPFRMFFSRWFIPSSVTSVSLFVIVMQLLKGGQI